MDQSATNPPSYPDRLRGVQPELSKNRPASQRYGIAVGAFLVGLAVRMVTAGTLGPTVPYITFFPAVVVSGWYGGFGPGMLTTILSVAAALFFLIPGGTQLGALTSTDAAGAVIFVVICALISRLQDAARRSAADARNSLMMLLSSEAERVRQRQWYEQTLASIGDAVIATDTAGRIEFVNAVAARLMGKTQQALLNQPVSKEFRLIDSDTRAPLEDPVTQVLRTQSAVTLPDPTTLLAANGQEILIGDSAAPILGDRSQMIGAVLVFRDISERRRAEQALRESEETFRLATESAHMGTWRNELGANRVTWSSELERIFGLQPGEFAGTEEAFYSYLHPADKQSVAAEIGAAIRERREYEIEFRFFKKGEAGVRWMLGRGRAYYDVTGKPLRLAGIATDITERKAAETALRNANRSLQAINEDLRQFSYAASHDLQEPLRMVVSYTQLLEQRYKNKIDGEANTFIGYAVDGALRLEHLLKGLLEYYRAGEDHNRQSEPVDCNLALQTALSNLTSAIEDSAAVITSDELPTCYAHAVPLVQLFQNLVGNALKYRGSEVPKIHVSASRNAQEWEFTVADNGIGINPKYLKQIFGVFKRLHGSDLPGTGVGLAICSRIVERYGGRIWAESELGKGTVFHFTLPDAS